MSRLIRLYPRVWRLRYEAEFLALLAERPPSVGDRVDIVHGALDARLRPQLPGESRVRDRRGYLALLGLGAWVGALLIWLNGPVHYDEYGSYHDGAAALPVFVLAVVLLIVALAAVVRRLPAGAARAVGSIALVAGPTWAVMPWVAPIGLLFLIGLVAVAAGARKAGIWSTWTLFALLGTVAAPMIVFAVTPFLPWYAMRQASQELGVLILLSLGGIWLVVGAALLHGHAGGTAAPA